MTAQNPLKSTSVASVASSVHNSVHNVENSSGVMCHTPGGIVRVWSVLNERDHGALLILPNNGYPFMDFPPSRMSDPVVPERRISMDVYIPPFFARCTSSSTGIMAFIGPQYAQTCYSSLRRATVG